MSRVFAVTEASSQSSSVFEKVSCVIIKNLFNKLQREATGFQR